MVLRKPDGVESRGMSLFFIEINSRDDKIILNGVATTMKSSIEKFKFSYCALLWMFFSRFLTVNKIRFMSVNLD